VIRITKFDGSSIILNPELIQTIEATPDTVITLTSGQQLVVKNSVEELVAAFMDYKRSISSSNWEARKAS
jgi:flagellar protein FlbD